MRDMNLIDEVKVVQLKNKNGAVRPSTVNRQPFLLSPSRNKPTRPCVLKIKSAGNAIHIKYFTCKI